MMITMWRFFWWIFLRIFKQLSQNWSDSNISVYANCSVDLDAVLIWTGIQCWFEWTRITTSVQEKCRNNQSLVGMGNWERAVWSLHQTFLIPRHLNKGNSFCLAGVMANEDVHNLTCQWLPKERDFWLTGMTTISNLHI